MTKITPKLQDVFPEIAAKYNKELNERDLSTIAPYSGFKAWWDCDKGHSWYGTVSSLTSDGQGCSACRGFQVVIGFNDLDSRFPEIASEWDYEKNDKTPKQVAHGTHQKVWWKCSKKGHSWFAQIFSRTNQGNNCPICGGKRILAGDNDFPTLYPETYKEWDHEKNIVDPSTLGGGSHYVAYWLCSKKHSYTSAIKGRTLSGRNCPVCSNNKILVGYNDLATTHSRLLAEWDYDKNEFLPTEIVAGTNRRAWWICAKEGHSWYTRVCFRTVSLANCPECGNANSSLVERKFREALNNSTELINVSKDSVKLPYLANKRKVVTVDATAELKDGTPVIFEFDGEYWHGSNSPEPNVEKKDIAKTKHFLEQGHLVIRVRELPLPHLDLVNDSLIQVSYKKSHGHKNIDDTIKQIDNEIGEML
jgi:hypothetical protein